MPLPTRRVIRPDSRHHREARRQRLSHRGGRRAGALRLGLMVLGLIGLMISALFATFSARHHTWVMPVLYVSAGAVVVSVLAMLLTKG